MKMLPPTEFKELVWYHFEKKYELLVGSDANVHILYVVAGMLTQVAVGGGQYEYLIAPGLPVPKKKKKKNKKKRKSTNFYDQVETRGLERYNI